MWRDHPFSQRDKTTKTAVGWRLEVTGNGGWTKSEKGGVDNKGGGGGLHKKGRLGTLCQLCDPYG